jgi:RecA/RadA recombinase
MSETQKTFTLDTSLAFDQTKQAAIVGWAMQDDLFCMQCVAVVKTEWFSSPTVAKIYGAIVDIYNQYHRRPSPHELKEYRPFTQEDAILQKRIPEVMADCLKQSKFYGLDILRNEMTMWMKAVIFGQSIQQAVNTFNAKKLDDAWAVVEDATLVKATASFEEGISQGFKPAVERIDEEREERMEQSKRILQFGVKFLDDNLGGIIPNDLIVLGAKTGAGKTQLATAIAMHNAQAGYPVHYFALEAENNEIERRIKYGLISSAYYRRRGDDAPQIGYGEWRMGKIDRVMKPFEESEREKIFKAVGNLQTLYRTSGSFDLRALEKNLMKVVTKSRLIIIDHLHYIDTNEDENHAYKQTIKLIRDIVLRFGIPVIVIAHLRKAPSGANKARTLVPMIEEFHGTSDVPKIATTCIMLDRADDPGHATGKSYLWPTYIGAVKSRLDGSRTRYVGLCNFDARSSRYQETYALTKSGYEWEELTGAEIPYWAKDTVQAAQEAEISPTPLKARAGG